MKKIDELSKKISKESSKGPISSRNKVSVSKMSSSNIIKPPNKTTKVDKSNKIPNANGKYASESLNNSKMNSSFLNDVSSSIKQYFSSKLFKKKKRSNTIILDNQILKDL